METEHESVVDALNIKVIENIDIPEEEVPIDMNSVNPDSDNLSAYIATDTLNKIEDIINPDILKAMKIIMHKISNRK